MDIPDGSDSSSDDEEWEIGYLKVPLPNAPKQPGAEHEHEQEQEQDQGHSIINAGLILHPYLCTPPTPSHHTPRLNVAATPFMMQPPQFPPIYTPNGYLFVCSNRTYEECVASESAHQSTVVLNVLEDTGGVRAPSGCPALLDPPASRQRCLDTLGPFWHRVLLTCALNLSKLYRFISGQELVRLA